ncbi:serine hydrolase domain-containing protein [Streptomyces sp. NPDC088923]|uniref:serine hydrolase domain-containing protein n=1 Tax=Streptomyces sp. NPDC088923 TaxID=3365913 RepID=UPI00382DA861
MSRFSRRLVVSGALVLSLSLGGAVAAAPAFAAHGGTGVTARAGDGISNVRAAALRDAVAGLPAGDATAALVRVGGDGRWRGTTGVHDVASGRNADAGARFRAGSTTKTFTAAVVLQLVDEKRILLDRSARSYLPGLVPPAYQDVTVRQLLNHTSGIPAAPGEPRTPEEVYAHRFDRTTPEAMVRAATAEPPEFAPGTAQHYLNINYTVLGLLVERVTGHRFEDEATRRVLRPLGLRDTYFPGTGATIKGPHNHGYQLYALPGGGTELRDVSDWDQTHSWAAGDLVSTTADLERFVSALFRGQVVTGPALAEMFALPGDEVRMYGTVDPAKPGSGEPAAYSAGLSHAVVDGIDVWGKTGARYGYSAGFMATQDLSRTLVYSVNSTDAKAQGVNKRVLGLGGAAFGRLPGEEDGRR